MLQAAQQEVDADTLALAPESAMKSFELLMEYTTFHIGVYTTLVGALITVLASGVLQRRQLERLRPFLWGTLVSFLIAGAFGGLTASGIPEAAKGSYTAFLSAKATFLEIPLITNRWAIHLEHLAFWVGIIVAVLGLRVATARPRRTGERPTA